MPKIPTMVYIYRVWITSWLCEALNQKKKSSIYETPHITSQSHPKEMLCAILLGTMMPLARKKNSMEIEPNKKDGKHN